MRLLICFKSMKGLPERRIRCWQPENSKWPAQRTGRRALAVGTLDPERSDVFSKIRKDFDAAGVVQSDEQILRVINELTLQAGSQMPVTRGGAPDALAVMLARQPSGNELIW